jgi:hypothetical protein
MTMQTTTGSRRRAERDLRWSWIFFVGTFVALVLNGIWSLVVGTASLGGDESDLVQGWEGVLRNLPAYVLLVVVAAFGVLFATRAGIHRSERTAAALVATSLGLLLALGSVTRDASEVVMTTRAATVAWAMFAVDVVVVGLVYATARRRISREARRSPA